MARSEGHAERVSANGGKRKFMVMPKLEPNSIENSNPSISADEHGAKDAASAMFDERPKEERNMRKAVGGANSPRRPAGHGEPRLRAAVGKS
jgi:hypothetical protein